MKDRMLTLFQVTQSLVYDIFRYEASIVSVVLLHFSGRESLASLALLDVKEPET